MALESPIIRCPVCKKQVARETYPWHCECGEPFVLEGIPGLDFKKIAAYPRNLWRYKDVYPLLEIPHDIQIFNAMTELTAIDLGGRRAYIKHEYQLPSGSFKDRGAAILAAHVMELGIYDIAEDTSGNAGIALSLYAGKLGITCHIYSTTVIRPAKEKKILTHGALLNKVSPDRQMVTEETLRQVREKYYASHIYNPYFIHGTKSMAYEIFEQLQYKTPDAVVAPVGNGSIILGLELGFKELKGMGYCPAVPKLIGVQSSARCPIVAVFDPSVPVSTGEKNIADGIDVSRPPRLRQILSAVRQTGGRMLAVTTAEIEAEMPVRDILGATIEPTSLVALAGARKYVQTLKHEELIVIPLSGANC